MEILILHLLGDYITQSDWMAQNKTTSSLPALVHSIVYSLPFLLLTRSLTAMLVIWSTHFLIDRFRLARYVVYAKNFIAPPSAVRYEGMAVAKLLPKYEWENCKATGYPSETPIWLATWLMIIVDNTTHLGINYLAIKYL